MLSTPRHRKHHNPRNSSKIHVPRTRQKSSPRLLRGERPVQGYVALENEKQWTEGENLWVQYISTVPATRTDVINLQDQLDRKLQQRQARMTGICPIRRELYAQCLDEIIRQVTINCPERGLLLLRIRNEILMTLATQETLYESSVAFGLRKALQGDLEKIRLRNYIHALEQEKSNLQNELNEIKAEYEAAGKRADERKALDDKRHSEDTLAFKKINQQLKLQLEGVITYRR
ncbi:33 kDa inner dynein arm light chain, axonemal-like [Heterodontus francisci]|uniref:33 kDa inner dynein arm light chain, axonemal-like n=1 Tax=Heterodontus francisci TaxID=7792 RepID=UPI00355C9884